VLEVENLVAEARASKLFSHVDLSHLSQLGVRVSPGQSKEQGNVVARNDTRREVVKRVRAFRISANCFRVDHQLQLKWEFGMCLLDYLLCGLSESLNFGKVTCASREGQIRGLEELSCDCLHFTFVVDEVGHGRVRSEGLVDNCFSC